MTGSDYSPAGTRLNLRRNAPAAPARPVPKRSMLVGSGIGAATRAWIVVMPLFVVGGTSAKGLFATS